jgi:hypothetical protein
MLHYLSSLYLKRGVYPIYYDAMACQYIIEEQR